MLVLATAVFFVALVIHLVKPHVADALAFAKAALVARPEDVRVSRPPETKKLIVHHHRAHTHRMSKPNVSSGPELGPFDAYVFDGNRYIRIEGMTRYALLDTRTGKIIWITESRQR